MIVSSAQEILEHYEPMRQEAVSRWNENWFCHDLHVHERHKFSPFPSIEVLEKFRDFNIGGIGLEHTDQQLDIVTHAALEPFERLPSPQKEQIQNSRANIARVIRKEFSGLPEEDPELAKLWKFSAFDPDDFGGSRIMVDIEGDRFPVSDFSVRTASRSTNAIRHLKQHQALKPEMSILELGGGFGRSLQMIAGPLSAETLFYVDLPVNLAIAAMYFKHASGKPVNLVWAPSEECVRGCVNIVAPWLLANLPDSIDLMINFLSLHHMPSETHGYYYHNLIKGRVSYLYHENRLEPRADHEGEGSLVHSELRQDAQTLFSDKYSQSSLFDTDGNFLKQIFIQKELLKY